MTIQLNTQREATLGYILSAIFGFYFTAIDTFLGRPDSLEAMVVISIFAAILMSLTVAVPAAILVSVVLYHVGPAIAEALWNVERAVRTMRSIAPLWAWAVIGSVMYLVGMPFGDVGAPHHATLVGSFYSVTFTAMMLAGIWAVKQDCDENTLSKYLCVFFAAGMLVACLSVPLFGWAVAPGIGIMTMFCGMVGMTIQFFVSARQQQPCHYRG